MQIKLYNNQNVKNSINKVLQNEIVLNGTLKEPSSILSPQIKVVKQDDILLKNYCYIEKFKRYYFIENITVENNNFLTLELSVDVLESFKTDILNSTQVIGRQENSFDLKIVDSEIIIKPNKTFQVRVFPNSPLTTDNFTDDDFIYTLTTGSLQSVVLTEKSEVS